MTKDLFANVGESQIQPLPMPVALPATLPGEGAINLELEQGV